MAGNAKVHSVDSHQLHSLQPSMDVDQCSSATIAIVSQYVTGLLLGLGLCKTAT